MMNKIEQLIYDTLIVLPKELINLITEYIPTFSGIIKHTICRSASQNKCFYSKGMGHTNGKIYTSNMKDNSIDIINYEGDLLDQLINSNSKQLRAHSILSSFVINESSLFLVDILNKSVHIISIFDTRKLYTIETPSKVSDIVIYHSRMYLLSQMRPKIYVYSLDGVLIRTIRLRIDSINFNLPSMAIHNNLIYIADYTNSTVPIFDMNGDYLSELRKSKTRFWNPIGVFVISDFIYVADGHGIYQFDIYGNKIDSWLYNHEYCNITEMIYSDGNFFLKKDTCDIYIAK